MKKEVKEEVKEADGSSVEGHAVKEQPAVPRLSVLLLSVGVESSGERAAPAQETHGQREESAVHTTRQVRRKTKRKYNQITTIQMTF